MNEALLGFCSVALFSSPLHDLSVCAHQCMYNSSALGKGNSEPQKAVAKGRELGGEANAC